MRQSEPRCDARGDAHGPVDARRDDPVDSLGRCEPVDARLVLCRDDRAPVRVLVSRRSRVTIGSDDVQAARLRSCEQAELGRPGP
jgi:hypothetical protein